MKKKEGKAEESKKLFNTISVRVWLFFFCLLAEWNKHYAVDIQKMQEKKASNDARLWNIHDLMEECVVECPVGKLVIYLTA